jgi:hypothetical protein
MHLKKTASLCDGMKKTAELVRLGNTSRQLKCRNDRCEYEPLNELVKYVDVERGSISASGQTTLSKSPLA